jgi:hypothetical protein
MEKHKSGLFIFRVMFDNLSLFLECALLVDEAPLKSRRNRQLLRRLKLAEIKERQARSSEDESDRSELDEILKLD